MSMMASRRTPRTLAAVVLLAVLMPASGCTPFQAPRSAIPAPPPEPPAESNVPRELDMVSLPPYVIEPPDIVLINAIKIVPKSPHKLEVFDVVLTRVTGTFPDEPIGEPYTVDPEGKIDLGPSYGRVKVVGLTIDEAQEKVRRHLSQILQDPGVSMSLAFTAGAQAITGEHLVGPDGRVNLGTYGSVFITGMTIDEAREAIEKHLSQFLDDPRVAVDIFSYNSKTFTVITEGAGFGDNVIERPITGNDTVLRAIAQLGGISQLSSNRIWIARPAPNGIGCEQILPVNWADISRGASTTTNYQLMPGDRLFIAEDRLARLDATVAKLTRPFERIFGFVSLGTSMANRIARFGLSNFQ